MFATNNMFETNSISLQFSEHFFVFFFQIIICIHFAQLNVNMLFSAK